MDIEAAETNIVSTAELMWAQVREFALAYAISAVGAVILILVGFVAARMLERWTRAGLARFPGVDETLRRFFSKIVRYAVLILVGVTVLAQFGVQTASIIAALGAAGLAIGLALQGTLQNIAAGIMLLVLKPFRVGEYIDASGIAGTVEEIGLFATELKAADGVFVMAPNSELWNKAVTNYSRNAVRRNDIAIGIGYDDDIGLAQKLMMNLATGDNRVLAAPAAETFVDALADSSVVVTLRYWTATSDFWQTRFDLTKAAKQAFDENGISIPFPQRQLHFVQADGAPPSAKAGGKAVAG
ncbi:mechanosensitive ion channel domain-containing protein [Chelativorans sp. AA-79]|uniref:mechanosensitive ion channel family protein n=1 Tax=Chelativorans sp. AA-79 TaxID=3028735 RepID=UPI0023F75A7A|nr:mechanosensitive ion channel domain-containing protein [Chelativorans sp. AA-79]WEX07666.1 mechanosensitive ion channel [Chelativorans sp. AA-79]